MRRINRPKSDKSAGDDLALTVFGPARRRVADCLRSRPTGYWTVDEVAAHEAMHRTVAFDHLEALTAAGLATKVSVRGARGRPANAYRYSGSRVEMSYPNTRSRLLAEVLAQSLKEGAGVRSVARRFGAAAGDLASLGGDYEVGDRLVHARTCIFGAVCEGAREVVCEAHAGLLEGALESEGRSCTLTPEGPDGLGGCRFRIA